MSEQSLLHRCPIVPVVVIHDAANAVPLGEALLAGGITVAEITLRTDAGIHAIEALAKELPELHVGAGSVLIADHVDQVVDAGAQFVVSPGLSVDVLTRSKQRGVPALPGVATSSELMTAVGSRADRSEVLPGRSARRPGRDPSPHRTLHHHVLHALRRSQRRQHDRLPGHPRRPRRQRQLDGRPRAPRPGKVGGSHRQIRGRHHRCQRIPARRDMQATSS